AHIEQRWPEEVAGPDFLHLRLLSLFFLLAFLLFGAVLLRRRSRDVSREVAEFLDLGDGREGPFVALLAGGFGIVRAQGAKLGEVAEDRLGDALRFLVTEAQLHGAVAILFHSAYLKHAVGAAQDRRDRHQRAIGVVNARMAQFFSEESE